MRKALIAFVVVELALLAGFANAADVAPAASRKAAPNFTLTDAKGADVKLADFKGKVVVLDFWATWCHGCKEEIPWFMEFESHYKDQGLAVIGVSMDDDGWKSVKPFMEEKKMNYTVVIGNEALGKQYGLDAMPLTVLIDRDGRIADSHSGVVDKDAWEGEIQHLLKHEATAK